MFKRNVGRLDRTVRLIAGGILTLLGLFPLDGLQDNLIGIYFTSFGLSLLLTGVFSFCMLYALLGISTRGKEIN